MVFNRALYEHVDLRRETLLSFLLLHALSIHWLLDSFFNDVSIHLSLSGSHDMLVVDIVANELAPETTA